MTFDKGQLYKNIYIINFDNTIKLIYWGKCQILNIILHWINEAGLANSTSHKGASNPLKNVKVGSLG